MLTVFAVKVSCKLQEVDKDDVRGLRSSPGGGGQDPATAAQALRKGMGDGSDNGEFRDAPSSPQDEEEG